MEAWLDLRESNWIPDRGVRRWPSDDKMTTRTSGAAGGVETRESVVADCGAALPLALRAVFRSKGRRSLVSKAWPRWLVPNWIS